MYNLAVLQYFFLSVPQNGKLKQLGWLQTLSLSKLDAEKELEITDTIKKMKLLMNVQKSAEDREIVQVKVYETKIWR